MCTYVYIYIYVNRSLYIYTNICIYTYTTRDKGRSELTRSDSGAGGWRRWLRPKAFDQQRFISSGTYPGPAACAWPIAGRELGS